MNSEAQVARMEPTGPALGRPDGSIRATVRGSAGGTGDGSPVQELHPLMRVISGVPNGGQRNPFAFQCRRTDVTKAFMVVATMSALTMATARAQAPEHPGAPGLPPDSAQPVRPQI